MPRVKRGFKARRRRNKILQMAKGYWGNRSRRYRSANETVERALYFSYRDRKAKKGDFRGLWIVRINAACREHGLSYSKFMGALHRAGVEIDRKVLADLAVTDSRAFAAVVEMAKAA